MKHGLHPYEMVRPDNITRSGIIQPFSVRAMDPVQYARAEINPFINAIRPMGANYAHAGGVTLDGAFGAMSAQQIPTLGAISAQRIQSFGGGGGFGIVSPEVIRSLGQTEDATVEARVGKAKIAFGVGGFTGGLILGALAGWLLFK